MDSSVDFISLLAADGFSHLAVKILSFLDVQSLSRAEAVCHNWREVVSDGLLWEKIFKSTWHLDPLWAKIAYRRNWMRGLIEKPTNDISAFVIIEKYFLCSVYLVLKLAFFYDILMRS